MNQDRKKKSQGENRNHLKVMKLKAKLSDNKEMIGMGFVLGAVTVLIAAFLILGLT